MKKEMLINAQQPEEVRIAIVEDGVLEELYVERTSAESYVNNIYKGRIVNIEPSIQAAFVDFGVGRNGFLHVSDVEPAYYRHLETQRDNDRGDRGRRGGRRDEGQGRDRRRRDEPDRERPPRNRDEGRRRREPAEPVEPVIEETSEERVGFEEFGFIPEPNPEADEPTPAEVEVSEQVAQEESAAETPPPTPLIAEDPLVEPEAPRERRRSRGSRRRREEPVAEEPASSEEPTAETSDEPTNGDPPRILPMDSAEHRTSDRSDAENRAPFDDDADLFFPREPAPQSSPPPPIVTAPPQFEFEEPDEEEPEPMPPVPAPAPAPAPTPVQYEEDDDMAEELADEREPSTEFDDEDAEELDMGGSRRSGGRGPGRGDRERGRGGPGGRDRGRGERRGGPGRRDGGRPKPLIQDIFKRGQEVLVQVIKEGIGTKGPTLSTYISIPGRYLVVMPHLNRVGVSRKIQDEEQRRRLRDLFTELKPPKGLGFIVRTAATEKNKKELQRDLAYLSRIWQVVVRRVRRLNRQVGEVYQESDIVTRTIRDNFTTDIDSIVVDDPAAFERAREFMEIVMPRFADRLKLYEGQEPLFDKFGIEKEIARIQQKHVPLLNGGSIVIEQTEALVSIDVNSGNFRADNNAEETAYQMNLLAAKEIARQIRLRDLGGVIVNDFIDMRDEKHKRGVERALKEAVKRDRARTKILKTSAFGIIEMTRQRTKPSLKRSVYMDCAHCKGAGLVKTTESMSIEVLRMLQLAAHHAAVERIEVRVTEDVAGYLHNRKRREIVRLEESGEIQVMVHGVHAAPPEFVEFQCLDKNGNEVRVMPNPDDRPSRRR